MKFLIADDKRIIGDLFELVLKNSGHEVTVVRTGKDALDEIRNDHYDMAFMDIIMPEYDGVEALEEIRKLNPGLPIVMMTGYTVQEKRERIRELGALKCMDKPFEMQDVRKAVKEALGVDI